MKKDIQHGAKTLSIKFSPCILNSFLSEDDARYRIVKCDLESDLANEHMLRFDINWIFDRVTIERRTLRKANTMFLACTACELSIRLDSGRLHEYSKDQIIPFSHTDQLKRSKKCVSEINPELSVGYSDIDANIKGLKLSFEKNKENTYTTNIKTDEHILATKVDKNSVTWDMQRPDVNKAIRHYLFGNIFLYAEFNVKKPKLSGVLEIRPRDPRIFNGIGEPISEAASWGVIFYLLRQGKIGINSLIPHDRILLNISQDMVYGR